MGWKRVRFTFKYLYWFYLFSKRVKPKSSQTFMCSSYIESLPDKEIPYILLVTEILI